MQANSTGDVAAARDQHALGHLLDVESLVGGDGVLDAGNVVRHPRPAADRDQDLGRCHPAPALLQLDRIGPGDPRPLVDQVRARLVQVVDVDARQPRDLDIARLIEARPVEAVLRRATSHSPPPS
jgi:hypothetical protein